MLASAWIEANVKLNFTQSFTKSINSTRGIANYNSSVGLKVFYLIKVQCSLICKCFAIGNYPYRQRCVQCRESPQCRSFTILTYFSNILLHCSLIFNLKIMTMKKFVSWVEIPAVDFKRAVIIPNFAYCQPLAVILSDLEPILIR